MKINYLGKFLDQPLLISKFEEKVPLGLTIGGAVALVHKGKDQDENKKKFYIQNTFAMGGAIASALLAPKITAKIFKENCDEFNKFEIIRKNKKLVKKFLKTNPVTTEISNILKKAKKHILNPDEIDTLYTKLNDKKEFLNDLIPEPENVSSKEIFSEIGRLSLFGLFPVVGGITGGTIGDYLTEQNWKEKFPDKVKEGVYQYLANIFLCNIGAGAALGIMEKANIKSKSARALAMVGGIILTGVIMGSKVANVIGDKFINPIFDKGKTKNKEERIPEPLDICLHTDDIATVTVMSGLKWIEPALPILYAVSGYRAGIGYRNHHKHGIQKQERLQESA